MKKPLLAVFAMSAVASSLAAGMVVTAGSAGASTPRVHEIATAKMCIVGPFAIEGIPVPCVPISTALYDEAINDVYKVLRLIGRPI